MNWLIALGATSLGLVVGWMAGQTFVRLKALDATALGAVVSVMVGAAVIGLFQNFVGGKSAGFPQEVWLYPVGLLAGVFAAVYASYSHEKTLRKIELGKTMEADKAAAERNTTESAKIIIQHLLAFNNWEMVSFDGIRAGTGQNWADEFLRSLILKYPDTFAAARLQGQRPGLKLLQATLEDRAASPSRPEVEEQNPDKAAEEGIGATPQGFRENRHWALRELVMNVLTSNNWNAISFEAIRRHAESSPLEWDQIMTAPEELVDKFPTDFVTTRVKTKKGMLPGLRLTRAPQKS
jgi:hypothetical protein